ncbi:MAG: 2-oxoacid:acceptor oxidoreductase subunit alpha [Planctomycetota bacterium]
MAEVFNDFTLRIATPNGTGSTSANEIIFKTLFHMGLAASAKNLFPSNIQGLPTWYQIRVSPRGYQARRDRWDVMVTLNPATLSEDLDSTQPGAVLIYNTDYNVAPERLAPFISYGVPFETLARKNIADAKLRPKLKNIIYVGVIAELFGLAPESIRAALNAVFKKKEAVVEENWKACELGIQYARENLPKRDPFRYQPAAQTAGKIIVDGNECAALGALFGGCSVVAWYPITPSSSLTESLIPYFEKLRTEPDGTRNYAVVQAEDELAAIGMVLGAGWTGARAMTATSGPGISLMGENLGFGYYTELPCVVFDVQRVGPSTGLPTRTQQSDLLQVAFHSHGDTRFPMLFPCSPTEAFEMSWQAFDLADHYQTPIVFMSDLDIGMNTWVDDTLKYPDRPIDRGKVLTQENIARFEKWGRYLDIDGDGIPYRAIPGLVKDPRAAFFTRGSGHDEMARYSESDVVYSRNLDRLARKIDGMTKLLPAPVVRTTKGAELGIIAFGSSNAPILEVLDDFAEPISYLRIRSFPFHAEIREFLKKHPRVLVIEQNQLGQIARLLRMEFPEAAPRIASARYYGGLPLTPEFVRGVLQQQFAKVR